MACPANTTIRAEGTSVGVATAATAETPSASITTSGASAQGAKSFDAQSSESGGTAVVKGDIIFFDSGIVAIVKVGITISDSADTTVVCYPLISAIDDADVGEYFGGYTFFGGVTGVNSAKATASLGAGDNGDVEFQKFTPGNSTWTGSFNFNATAPHPALGIMKGGDRTNLYWFFGYPNGVYKQGCGFATTDADDANSGNLITGNVSIQGNGELTETHID